VKKLAAVGRPYLDLAAELLAAESDQEIIDEAEERKNQNESVESLEEAKALEEARLDNGPAMDPAVIKRYEVRKAEVSLLALFLVDRIII
jgi:hypothetical protein